jgi:hypothetical protein
MTAQLFFNHARNMYEIDGECAPDLADAAKKVGYTNGFHRDNVSVYDVMDELKQKLPAGFSLVTTGWMHEKIPAENIRIGQYKVRTGDPVFPIYIVRSASLAAMVLGKIGGSAKTEPKREASRANGKLGGRPNKNMDMVA